MCMCAYQEPAHVNRLSLGGPHAPRGERREGVHHSLPPPPASSQVYEFSLILNRSLFLRKRMQLGPHFDSLDRHIRFYNRTILYKSPTLPVAVHGEAFSQGASGRWLIVPAIMASDCSY